MNRDRLLADAKAKALSLVDGYVAPEKPTFRLAGASGRTGLNMAVAAWLLLRSRRRRQGVAVPA